MASSEAGKSGVDAGGRVGSGGELDVASHGIILRHATREDVPSILSLIHALALYEHEPAAVLATTTSLLATLSFATGTTSPQILEPISPQRPARALLLFKSTSADIPAVETDEPGKDAESRQGQADRAGRGRREEAVGLALYFHNYSTWRAAPGIYLEDLFVLDSERGKGYGKLLLAKLAGLVLELGGARLEWSVLKWNVKSIGFYEAIGALKMDEWVGMRVEGREGLEKVRGVVGGG